MAEWTYKLDIDMLERKGTSACLDATRAMIARIRELERDKADWLKANAPGGWIDDLRRASQPGSGEAVAKIVDVDEYGPQIQWSRHWVDLKGRTLYVKDEK